MTGGAGVIGEPVSAPIPCYQGICEGLLPILAFVPSNSAEFSGLLLDIPMIRAKPGREFCADEQGILSPEAGYLSRREP